MEWANSNGRAFPWRSETDGFRILVGELLLQRSRSSTVSGVYESLFRRWPTAVELALAPIEELTEMIRPLGLLSRALRLASLAAAVAERGSVPVGGTGELILQVVT